ncbi:MAG: NADH-quinone oxidoreductase subunit NuoF [Clostridiales bacterium]|nr:MAG: NADH-quinone oxidoreductase subunit NuoF [Clostridiales bacterium]
MYTAHILVCGGTGCLSQKSEKIIEEFNQAITEKGIVDRIKVVKTGCFGFCGAGPIVKILPDNTLYVYVKEGDAAEILNEHIIKGNRVERLLYKGEDGKPQDENTMQFYKKQFRIALRNCGMIDPEKIEDYLGFDGYLALGKVLNELTPEGVCKTILDSGLRGRGGGGFPTGLKWDLTRKQVNEQKYIICNADEGDPGAFMDRSILEGDPHSVLEAMAIGGYAIGANKGLIYIRAEYPLAINRLRIAIKQAKEKGFLGENILNSGFNFDIDIRLGAGAFVCGEETALINSVEGRRGEPTKKPPFPSVEGLWGKPTCVNNVETYANIPVIIREGADWFKSYGTEKCKGTKVFALAGKVNNIGLIEVPMGTTLREIIFDIGGGIIDGKAFKAVQTGGPSGGVITEQHLDTPIDYESLQAINSIMGSGGMIVMDESNCMVSMAKFFLEFTQDESCGKCTPCRIGTKRMYEILDRLCKGQGKPDDIERLEELGNMIKDSSLCGLGQTAPNPVLSTIRFFREEYEEHINGTCRSGECKDLLKYTIDPIKCKGCTLCARKCPVTCISGERRRPHIIDQESCIKCGACFDVCNFDAVMMA